MIALQEPLFDVGEIVQVLVVFFLFVLPVLRGIVQSQRKQREREERRREASGEVLDRDGERAGRDAWEQLLRGEEPPPSEPVAPVELESLFPAVEPEPEPEPEPAPPPPPAPRERAADQGLGGGRLAGLSGRRARAGLEPRLGAELKGYATADLTTLDDDAAASLPGAARSAFAAGVDWRRAVVLSEFLASPVALRGEPAFPGTPAGLR